MIRIWVFLVAVISGLGAQEKAAFLPLEKAKGFTGELVFVDHVNRRGSLRLHVDGHYHEGQLHHFAMLPYGVIRYRGAPAALKDIPIGTVLHGRFFLPPEPKTSVVPVVNPKRKDVTRPPENHAILLEDEMSLRLREGQSWKLVKVDVKGTKGTVSLKLGKENHEMTIDDSTRIWRGKELLGIDDMMAGGSWPKDGLNLPVQLGLTWHPRYLYEQFHLSDLWLDEEAVEQAVKRQAGVHRRHVKLRWMPARVDAVEHGEFGQAVVTATLFGGMDESLYADFKEGVGAQMAAAESTLRTWWPDHDGMDGKIVKVTKSKQVVPLGSSGIQIKFDVELVLEGFRPGRTVKIRPHPWPKVKPPYEELVKGPGDRWPGHEIFE